MASGLHTGKLAARSRQIDGASRAGDGRKLVYLGLKTETTSSGIFSGRSRSGKGGEDLVVLVASGFYMWERESGKRNAMLARFREWK
jgi:hypothetical protein